MSLSEKLPKSLLFWLKIAGLLFCLYLFIVGVSGMGEAFKLFGEGFASRVLTATSNPFAALLMGIIATAIIQSSSATTSIIVGMVAGGALPMSAAIPMVMGSNIGTTITASMVSIGSVRHKAEFERAFSAALLHLLFNMCAVAVLFPLETCFGILSDAAIVGEKMFAGMGGMHLANPLKVATGPAIDFLSWISFHNPWVMLAVTLALTFFMLIFLVKVLRSLVLSKVEAFFDKVLFRSWPRSMFFGFILTFVLQTSSVTTSLTIPLAGAGVLKLLQIFPFILGANVGTTVTAFLAAMATGNSHAIIVAFSHIAFNILGIIVIWPIPAVRRLPVRMTQYVAHKCMYARFIPLAMIVAVYFAIPLLGIILFS